MVFYMSVLLLSEMLICVWLHGRVYTESEAVGDATLLLTRVGVWTNIATLAGFLGILSSQLLVIAGVVDGISAESLLLQYGWWLIGIAGVNLILGIIANIVVAQYYRRRFGSNKPNYNNWPEWDQSSGREGRDIVIVNQRWPFGTTSKPSLSKRTASRSSSYGSGHRASSLGASYRTLGSALVGSSTRSGSMGRSHRSTSSRRSSGSSSGSGLAGALARLLALLAAALAKFLSMLIRLLIYLALALALVLVLFISYKTNMLLVDWFDENYTISNS